MITSHGVERSWSGAVALVVVTLAMLQAACQKVVVPVWRFQCPDQGVLIRLADTTGGRDSTVDSTMSIPLSGPIADIPEYHDCQRFLDSAGAYGSVYAIFAAFRLDTVSGSGSVPLPVATVYTPDGTYSALGILPGFNCLVLSRMGDSWTATMVARGQGKQNADCSGAPTSANETALEVKQQAIAQSAGFGSNDFPPTARWDWDTLNKKQYIGIRCGAAWCEVGAKQFMPSPAFDGNLIFDPIAGFPYPDKTTMRVQRIKGWYDEQQLADTLQPQRPGPVHGLLFPNPALDLTSWPDDDTPDHKKALGFYANRWVQVAFALVDGDYPKWHFTKGKTEERYGKNKIYLCYGIAGSKSCDVPTSTPPENSHSIPVTSCMPDPTNKAMHWWSKTISATGEVSYGCIKRMDHSYQLTSWRSAHRDVQYGIPGTARWKFLVNDESTWVSCPSGCCTKQ